MRATACPFLTEYAVDCEAACTRARMHEGAAMLHAPVGYRVSEKNRRAGAIP